MFTSNVIAPFLVADVADVGEGRLVRSVVDEDVDPAELPNGTLDHAPAVVGRAKVALHQDGFASLLLDEVCDFLSVVGLIEIGDQDIRPLASEGDGDGASNSAVAAGSFLRACLEGDPNPYNWSRRGLGAGPLLRGRAGHRLSLPRIWRLGIVGHGRHLTSSARPWRQRI